MQEVFTWLHWQPVERPLRGDAHGGCGGRTGETGREKSRYRAPVRPNYNAKLCINGHHWAQRQAGKAGLGHTAMDTAFASVDDPAALQAICDQLGPERIDGLLRKWLARLPHPFTAADRAAGYRYELSILQAEFSLTQMLDRPVSGRIFFEQVIRDNLDLGRPDQVSLVFARRVRRDTPGPRPPRRPARSARWCSILVSGEQEAFDRAAWCPAQRAQGVVEGAQQHPVAGRARGYRAGGVETGADQEMGGDGVPAPTPSAAAGLVTVLQAREPATQTPNRPRTQNLAQSEFAGRRGDRRRDSGHAPADHGQGRGASDQLGPSAVAEPVVDLTGELAQRRVGAAGLVAEAFPGQQRGVLHDACPLSGVGVLAGPE